MPSEELTNIASFLSQVSGIFSVVQQLRAISGGRLAIETQRPNVRLASNGSRVLEDHFC